MVKGVAREVPLELISRGAFPFLLAMIAGTLLLVFFPQIALFLPGLIR